MLYVAFFSHPIEWKDIEKYGDPQGRFIYLIEAPNADSASEQMAEKLTTEYRELFNDTPHLVLDDLVEIIQLPPGGVILHCQRGPVKIPPMECILPHYDGNLIAVYNQEPDEIPENGEGLIEVEPEAFIVFDEPPLDRSNRHE